MSSLQGLALNAFLARRHVRARRLFAAARSRVGAVDGDASAWPNHVHRVLAGIVEEALAGDGAAGSAAFEVAIERVGALLLQLPVASSHRDQVTRRAVERVGFELARLAGRSDLMRGFGPPMTVPEAAWAILADPDVFADDSDDAVGDPDGASEDREGEEESAADGASSVTVDHLVAAAQHSGPTVRFSYPPYVFASLDQQAQVRFSSPRLFEAFEARMSHTGRQTTERTSFTLRPAGAATDVADRIVDEIGGQHPAVRFEFAAYDDGAMQIASFRDVMVGRAADGIELILDYGKAAFRTGQMPEEVWRALGSNSPVTVAIVL